MFMLVITLLIFPLAAIIMFFLGVFVRRKRKLFFILAAILLALPLLAYYLFTIVLKAYGVDFIQFH